MTKPLAAPVSQPICTCQKDGSMKCKFPHPCRHCHVYHPGVSCYWATHGKTSDDKKGGGKTFTNSSGNPGCAECCNGDRCDDPTHYNRDNCPYCLGSGSVPEVAAPLPEPMNLRNYEVGPEYLPNRIKEFEAKYSASSADLLVAYKARLCNPNNLDFDEWAALLDIQAHQEVPPLPEIASEPPDGKDVMKAAWQYLQTLLSDPMRTDIAYSAQCALEEVEASFESDHTPSPVPLGEPAQMRKSLELALAVMEEYYGIAQRSYMPNPDLYERGILNGYKEVIDAAKAALASKAVPLNNDCDVCCGDPLPNGKQCICGGSGRSCDEKIGLRMEIIRLEEELASKAVASASANSVAAYRNRKRKQLRSF